MTRGWRVVAGWGAWLCVLAAVQIIFTPTAIELALIGGAALGMVALGLLVLGAERRRLGRGPETGDPVALQQSSVASVTLALGLAVFVVGWELGAWMIAIGAGVVLLGIGGLVRERRAQRL